MPDFISFRASRFSMDSGRVVATARTATSLRDERVADRWQRRLEPWLLAGDPLGCSFLDFGDESAFLRWHSVPGASGAWNQALVLVGDSTHLSGTYALELPALDPPQYSEAGPAAIRGLAPDGPTGPQRDAIAARARSAEALASLIPALANALNGRRRVALPWTGPQIPGAAMWGLLAVLRATSDERPVSFGTHVTGHGRDGDTPGLLVTFRPDISEPRPQPEHGFAILAGDIAARFAEDPAALGRMLAEHGPREVASLHDRVGRLLALPLSRPFSVPQAGKPPVPEPVSPEGKPSETTPSRTDPEAVDGGGKTTVTVNHGSGGPTVMCPVCLADIDNWDALDYWRHDPDADDEWMKIDVPADLSPTQRSRYQHGAYVRCEKGSVDGNVHHLPARYGRFGEPVLLGFVGLTESGKSHLLTSMVGRIEALSEYQIAIEALDPELHKRFMENSVEPLITRSEALPGTPDRATALRDAFIVRYGAGPERVVALFDVSGGDLAETGMGREFLWIADGLFFVIDPDHIARSKVGDATFGNVLSIIRDRAKPGPKGAAIILNKADKGRFEEPAARWLRAGEGVLDPVDFLRESADVYAYLQRHGALALAAPYEAAMCEKATLHVASPTGGAKESEESEEKKGRYPRGVTPMRVLRPLVAMLAMTGVLTGPQAELIGV
jgi:hypothetical protein